MPPVEVPPGRAEDAASNSALLYASESRRSLRGARARRRLKSPGRRRYHRCERVAETGSEAPRPFSEAAASAGIRACDIGRKQ